MGVQRTFHVDEIRTKCHIHRHAESCILFAIIAYSSNTVYVYSKPKNYHMATLAGKVRTDPGKASQVLTAFSHFFDDRQNGIERAFKILSAL